ncbi:hypothetical protein ADL12_41920 [Streptomyces regalis]|uniref:Uncharacterized protein n=1 Tax=Streptomyces regalis TaxID=68262 RepID=A0A101J9H3_9ACTN|nr:hypothetical protein ADL12_41920 [Streptomyces regalis]
MDLLQHRRLDLEEAALQQALAQGLDGGGAGADHVAGGGAGDQVEVAHADLRLGVGEAAAFVGQGSQALAQQLPGGDEDGRLALVADAGQSGGGDEVADVGVGGEAVEGGAGVLAGEGELVVAGPVAQHGEDEAAEVAHEHDPAGDGDLLARSDVGEDVGAGRDAHRVGVDAVGAQPVEGVVPDADLLGQARIRPGRPGLVPSVEAECRQRGQSFGGRGTRSVPRVPLFLGGARCAAVGRGPAGRTAVPGRRRRSRNPPAPC